MHYYCVCNVLLFSITIENLWRFYKVTEDSANEMIP